MKILDKYIELIKKGYCSDYNELNCIDNFPQEKIVQEIKQLQQENQQLKKQKDDVVEYIKTAIEDGDYFEADIDSDIQPASHDKYVNSVDILRMLGEIDVED